MKQIITKALAVACAGALVLSMTACGGKSATSSAASNEAASSSEAATSTLVSIRSAEEYDYESFDYSAGLDENGYWEGIKALDYVTLPADYAAIPLARADVEPTSEEVQSKIDDLLSQNATTNEITDRKAENGDTVNIDYAGSVDGVAFNGGTYSGYSLTLGSGSFIDDFEDQIVGHTPGDSFDVTVTFPDGYEDSTDEAGNPVVLSNKEAVFAVKLNYIEETVIPELTDEWVDATFGESNDIHTAAEVELFYQQMLYQQNLQSAVIDYLVENSTFKEIPQVVADYQVEQCLNYYYTMAGYYGYELDDFITSLMGYDSADAMLSDMSSNIEQYAKEAMVYQAVAEAMSVAPTQEQLDAYSAYTETYGQGYCTMVAMMDAVTEALTAKAVVS